MLQCYVLDTRRRCDAIRYLVLPPQIGRHEMVLHRQQTDDGLDAA